MRSSRNGRRTDSAAPFVGHRVPIRVLVIAVDHRASYASSPHRRYRRSGRYLIPIYPTANYSVWCRCSVWYSPNLIAAAHCSPSAVQNAGTQRAASIIIRRSTGTRCMNIRRPRVWRKGDIPKAPQTDWLNSEDIGCSVVIRSPGSDPHDTPAFGSSIP